MQFEWDPNKARTNRTKHGISFETAVLAFRDERAVIIEDDRFDYEECREILIGLVPSVKRCLMVVFTEREEDLIRVISARKATRLETDLYYEENG